MNKLLIIILFGLLVLSCKQKVGKTATPDHSIKEIDSLTNQLQAIQDKNILPGFALSIFTKDKILYQKGFGYSDIKTRQPYSIDNVQIIASITKTLIGVSLMKAVEDGKLSLDEAINDILPYQVSNPEFPDKPITIRHLATHTSSISSTSNSDDGYRFETPLLKEDFPEVHHKYFKYLNKTDDLSMANYLEYKLSEQGKWYEQSIFISSEPGTAYEYSNLGATLLAHCIEIRTGESFDEYSNELILKPLKMSSSTWSLEEVNQENEITYYNEIMNEVPRYRIVSYPDGGLYSSVSDLTKYFQEMMKGHIGEGNLLDNNSFQMMMTKQYDEQAIDGLVDGLCWDLSMGTDLVGHAGNDYGTATVAYFSPDLGIGRILFTNISIEKDEQSDVFYGIYNTLFKYDFKKASR